MISKVQLSNLFSRIKTAHQTRIVNKYLKICEGISPDICTQLEYAKPGIVNYAKANNVSVSLIPGDKNNVINLLVKNLDRKPTIGVIKKPLDYVDSPNYSYKNLILKVSKEKGLNIVKCIGKTEDNFLRYLYRNIELLVDSMKY